jgi:hypothetical protein
MDLIRTLLNPGGTEPVKKPVRPGRAKAKKPGGKRSSTRRPKREITAAQAVREADLRG